MASAWALITLRETKNSHSFLVDINLQLNGLPGAWVAMILMNSFKKYMGLLAGSAGLLWGCGASIGPDVTSRTSPGAAPVARSGGSFPDRALVAQLEPGVRDADLLRWFGAPALGGERGDADAAAWEYLFHFRSGGGVTSCRVEVSFDRARVARGIHWQPSACGDWLSVKTPAQAQGKAAP